MAKSLVSCFFDSRCSFSYRIVYDPCSQAVFTARVHGKSYGGDLTGRIRSPTQKKPGPTHRIMPRSHRMNSSSSVNSTVLLKRAC